MKIMRILTRKHLMANKGRTLVTIVGIAISVAMITAVLVAMASFFTFAGNIAMLADGNQHVTFFNRDYSQLQEIRKDKAIAQVGNRVKDDSESGFLLAGEGGKRKRVGSLYTADSNGLQQIISCQYDGDLPKNLHEIAVEESFLLRNDMDPEQMIGKEITFEMGRRSNKDSDGKAETYYGNYQEDEIWEPKGTVTCTVTAILYNNPATKAGFKIIRGISEEELQNRSQADLATMITLKKVNYRSDAVIDQMIEKYHVDKYEKNTDLLDSHFSLRPNSTFASLLPMISIIVIIIVLASVLLIYNAFAMSLTEKVKYLGMLASVGATKAQKRFSVYYEGFLLGLIGIPLGFLAGLLGINVTLKVVSHLIRQSDMIPSLAENQGMVALSMTLPLWIIPVITLFSIVTISLAAFIPAKRASKIMPIDAIRQTTEIKIKKKKITTPKYVKALFGYEGELAYKNMKRNGSKARIITASIAISVILFLSVSHFCELFWSANGGSYSFPFQIIATVKYQQAEAFEKELQDIPGVEKINPVNMLIYEYKEGSENSPNFDFMAPNHFKAKYRKKYAGSLTVALQLLSDEDFEILCQHNGLEKEDYYGDSIRAALCNNVSYRKNGQAIFSDQIIGAKMFYDDKEKFNAAEIEIADFVKWEDNDRLYGMHGNGMATAFAPLSQYVKVLYGDDIPDGFTMDYGIYTQDKALVYEKILDLYEEGNYEDGFCQNNSDDTSTMNAVMYILEIFTYGFITLISMITIANIVNSISTGITQRRKEFAMLKSVGMTQKGFMKMIRLETLLYGIRALILALPISLLLGFAMNFSLAENIPFQPNVMTYLLVIVAVFLLLGLTMFASISRLKNDRIIDALKMDIF